jgi:hypothetical protein
MEEKIKSIKEFNVGDTAYMLTVASYYKEKDKLQEVTIKNVGKKYVFIGYGYIDIKFEESDWLEFGLVEKSDTSPIYYLFKSMEDYGDWLDKKRLRSYMSRLFSSYGNNVSLRKLREIEEIIGRNDDGRN